MASVRYEFIKLGSRFAGSGFQDNVITDTVGTGGTLAVTTTATTAGSRPQVPSSGKPGDLYVRLTAIDGPVHF